MLDTAELPVCRNPKSPPPQSPDQPPTDRLNAAYRRQAGNRAICGRLDVAPGIADPRLRSFPNIGKCHSKGYASLAEGTKSAYSIFVRLPSRHMSGRLGYPPSPTTGARLIGLADSHLR